MLNALIDPQIAPDFPCTLNENRTEIDIGIGNRKLTLLTLLAY